MNTIMKTYFLAFILFLLLLSSCNSWLDEIEPKDKVPTERLFSDPGGIKTYLANLYYSAPFEDFNYTSGGFDSWRTTSWNNNRLTEEGPHKNGSAIMGGGDLKYFAEGYTQIRNINLMVKNLPDANLKVNEKALYLGESYFLLAYTYFALVKRCGGVPLITKVQEYVPDNIESLKIPRSTEKESWDFTLALCDSAIKYLPAIHPLGERRAGGYTANALKSRIALHAASVAKFWDEGAAASSSDPAIQQKLVGGMTMNDANNYYNQCINASLFLINSKVFSLYMPNPASPDEASANLQKMFTDPNVAPSEMIFIKGYTTEGQGHSYQMMVPYQIGNSFSIATHNPTLDMVEYFEDYTDDGKGGMVKLNTLKSGKENIYADYNKATEYVRYASPMDIFNGVGPIGTTPNKAKRIDARLFSSIMLPGSTWKGLVMNFQGGLVKIDGTNVEGANFTPVVKNGINYYALGGASTSLCSGWSLPSNSGTRTGFLPKKFMNENGIVNNTKWASSINDWPEFRYAEILLNYAEAVVENTAGYGDQTIANNALNSIRRRAGHTDNVVATRNITSSTEISVLGSVQRERIVELAYENKRHWDLLRRREYHKAFNNRRYGALKLYQDLRTDPVSYFYVRTYSPLSTSGRTFDKTHYYRMIDGVASSGLVQNPGY